MNDRSIIREYFKISVGLLLVLAIPPVKPASAQKGDAAIGQEIFIEKCQRCYGENGSGNTDLEKPLGPLIFAPPMSKKSPMQICIS